MTEIIAVSERTQYIQQTPERPLVFMGGIGYDSARNREVGSAIIDISGHTNLITISDETEAELEAGRVAVHRYSNETEYEMPLKTAKKALKDEEPLLESRHTVLHEKRAERLIAQIEQAGGKPVDAVFQSVDVSTGILAMYRRPDLFNKVVLVDPSSIAKLPNRLKYLKEEWQNGNLRQMIKRKKDPAEKILFEKSATPLEKAWRIFRSSRGGNMLASYLSFQAPLLHQIAKGENVPNITILASRHDHAYTPERILNSLVDLDDISAFFITNSRHGLGGKKQRLEQLVEALTDSVYDTSIPILNRVHFFDDISEKYKAKILEIVSSRKNH
jgi:hypothetical protein